jgi:3-oxoacyl-[acyl-carrier protein] reductase
VVVNTAGIMLLGPLVRPDLADFDRMHKPTSAGTPSSRSSPPVSSGPAGGALVHFSTSVTRSQQPASSAYAAIKGAVEPGRRCSSTAKSEQAIDTIAFLEPMERLGAPEDIAERFSRRPGRLD